MDAAGLVREIGGLLPSIESKLRLKQKALIDHWLGDCGNYPPEYARHVETELKSTTPVAFLPSNVDRFLWSGENHDIGRCSAAIQLADFLFERSEMSDHEFLLWGHSHGGNVLALLTNLMGADKTTIRRLFRAIHPYRRHPPRDGDLAAVGQRVYRKLLSSDRHAVAKRLHIVTFGTPVVYGWDESGYRTLMHFVYVPRKDILEQTWDRVPSFEEVIRGEAGDSVQRLAVAGTEIRPTWLQIHARLTNRRLARWWHPHGLRRRLRYRWKYQPRLHQSGLNVLVDYALPVEQRSLLKAHGVYTRREHVEFHLHTVAQLIQEELYCE